MTEQTEHPSDLADPAQSDRPTKQVSPKSLNQQEAQALNQIAGENYEEENSPRTSKSRLLPEGESTLLKQFPDIDSDTDD